jgi:hypothetical protein
MIRTPFLSAALAFLGLTSAGAARAQDEPPTVVPIVVRPAAAPVPALADRILPERGTLIPGNAAIFYHRAVEKLLELRRGTPPPKAEGRDDFPNEQVIAEWIGGPPSAIPLDRARRWLARSRGVLHECELGARRQSCDWEFDSRTEGFELTLAEIQEMRSLVRLVALRIRVAILEHQPNEALSWLQTGFAMGRHVTQGPSLIQPLVGAACFVILTRPVEDLIQSPGMPSLYWALANRPRPFLDFSPALEGERFLLERELPQLRELDGVPWSVEKARGFADALQSKLFSFAGINGGGTSAWESLGTSDWVLGLGVAAMVAQAYPEAKRALIAQGRTPAQVEAMPATQVAALYTYQTYAQYRDDVYKWAGLPYYQAARGLKQEGTVHLADRQRRPLLKLFTALLPSIRLSCLLAARVDRQLDALQCIEAIRIYAKAHQRLPAGLDEIAEAPVPIDPLTGRAFEYHLDGETATLSAPAPPGAPPIPLYRIHYEMTLAR